ncbi:MAG: SH3 domain-containing protein [Desulfobacterales bacterium]|nr:SH3 domain-containing protein [Desulfobacterales bacterium]
MKLLLSLLVMSICLFQAVIFAIETKVWVSSQSADVYLDKTVSSARIETLRYGIELRVISQSDKWAQVKTPKGKTGWIYRGKISDKPITPNQSASQSDTLFGGLSGNSTIQASAQDSARSIRGLSDEAREYGKITQKPEVFQNMLDQILKIRVTSDDIQEFLLSGNIGEYAQ